MALKSFCGILTLQVGAAILSAVFLTLANVIFIVNVFDFNKNSDYEGEGGKQENYLQIALLFVLIFVVGLIIAGVFAFLSAYKDSRTYALAAMLILIVLLIYWLVLSALSFMGGSDFLENICVHRRCPETFWLASLNYRTSGKGSNNDEGRQRRSVHHINYSATAIEDSSHVTMVESSQESNTHQHFDKSNIEFQYLHHELIKGLGVECNTNKNKTHKVTNNDSSLTSRLAPFKTLPQMYYLNQNSSTEVPEFGSNPENNETMNSQNVSSQFLSSTEVPEFTTGNSKTRQEQTERVSVVSLITAIILFIFNFIFMVYSAFTLWSWAEELDWSDAYIEDQKFYN